MAKLKQLIRNTPIWVSYVFVVIVFGLITWALILGVRSWSLDSKIDIELKYPNTYIIEGPDVTYFDLQMEPAKLTDEDQFLMSFFTFTYDYCPWILSAFFLAACAFVYYFAVLKKPIRLLSDSSKQIELGNLDFNIDYHGKNELARTCMAFDDMRQSLKASKAELQAVAEHQKTMNDIYTHELRTPIAILSGSIETLKADMPSECTEKIEIQLGMMSNQISRLTDFCDCMNTIQHFEDREIKTQQVSMDHFLPVIKDTASALCAAENKQFYFDTDITADSLSLDADAISTVYENLLTNALRFAEQSVSITVNGSQEELCLVISDDGPGIDESKMHKLGHTYYKEQKQNEVTHFGLGLYISCMLCEKHKGSLILENNADKGATVTAVFSSL